MGAFEISIVVVLSISMAGALVLGLWLGPARMHAVRTREQRIDAEMASAVERAKRRRDEPAGGWLQ